MNRRRLFGPVVLGTLAAGGLAFLAASRAWVQTRVQADGLPTDALSVSGSTAQPLVPALALVVVTAALAALASSVRLRRIVGAFTMLVAIVGVALIATGGSALESAVQQAVEESPAFTGTNIPDTQQHTIWRLVAAVAFVLAAMLGALTARFAPIWPTMGSRYDAPRSRTEIATPETEADIWKAFDQGRDPTQ